MITKSLNDWLMSLSREPLLTVNWQRSDGEVLMCKDLTSRVAIARLMKAIKNSGPITVVSVEVQNDSRT